MRIKPRGHLHTTILTRGPLSPDTAFLYDGQQWIFNITTSNLAAGSTYVHTITLNDGSTIVLQFGLR